MINGELDQELDIVEAAWAECAAKVDSIVECQNNEKTTGTTPISD